jgi:membrane protease YdiL (CAAX protease family)
VNADRREGAGLAAVTAVWIGSATVLAQYAAPWLPRALAAHLGLQSFLCLVLALATLLGAAAAKLLVPRPVAALGLAAASPSAWAAALLSVPLVSALSMYAGFTLALPTLIAEIRAGGQQAAQANTGEFGRALVETHIATTILWAIVLTPVVEELMFRGALWGAVQRLTRGLFADERELPPELRAAAGPDRLRRLTEVAAPAIVSAAVFTWLHADQPGGAGIVRVVQCAALGLTLGVLRHAAGSVAPGILLHAGFNLLALAKSRKWIGGAGWPPPLPIPVLFWQLALAAAFGLTLLLVHRLARLRAVETSVAIHVARPRSELLDALPEHASPPTRAWLLASATSRHDLDDDGSGTELRWTVTWTLRSGLYWPVARVLARSEAAAMRARLERDRSHLESARGERTSDGAAAAQRSGQSGS